MKKLVLVFFTLSLANLCVSQTLLASIDLDLKKASSHYRGLNAVNTVNNDVVVFASDKEKLTAIRYNGYIFFKDSLSVNRPDKDFSRMAGYSFNSEGIPEIYWSDADFKTIKSLSFDFKNRDTSEHLFTLPLEKELLLSSFSENNSYHILTVSKTENELKLYVFNDGQMKEKFIDFSEFKIQDQKSNPVKLWSLLEENPIEKIEINQLNSLIYAAATIKFYVLADKIIFTFDHTAAETRIVELNLQTYKATERSMAHETLKSGTGQSNSYYSQGKLYQLKANKDELSVTVRDYASGETIATFDTQKDDVIAYKNSPLFMQTGNQRRREFKNTKKFLEKLENSQLGITVYDTPTASFLTIGGHRNVASTGGILLGIAAGVGSIATGADLDMGNYMDETLQVSYFETHLDSQSRYFQKQQEVLATDHIAQFLDQNRDAALVSTFKFKNHFILGYYDLKAKKYILRKFVDDFQE